MNRPLCYSFCAPPGRFSIQQAWCGAAMLLLTIALALGATRADAGERLLATWGVSQVEGAGGGGLTPWATITGTGSSDQVGGSAFVTHASTQDGYRLKVVGAALGIHDRIEFSLARWSFKISPDVIPDKSLEMSVVGVKARVLGDAVYDQDSWVPQVSVGAQYKMASDTALIAALGGREADDMDLYVSATKVWLGAALGHNVLGSATVRWTRANQFGLLGFGGGAEPNRTLHLEGSLGVMLRDDLVVGAEYRSKPDNLGLAGFEEDSAYDVFMAWFPHRQASLTAAWLNMGNVATKKDQKGFYLSGQLAF